MPKRKAAAGQLKLRHVAVDTFHENAAYMHGDTGFTVGPQKGADG